MGSSVRCCVSKRLQLVCEPLSTSKAHGLRSRNPRIERTWPATIETGEHSCPFELLKGGLLVSKIVILDELGVPRPRFPRLVFSAHHL
jgi:hypothetical protein